MEDMESMSSLEASDAVSAESSEMEGPIDPQATQVIRLPTDRTSGRWQSPLCHESITLVLREKLAKVLLSLRFPFKWLRGGEHKCCCCLTMFATPELAGLELDEELRPHRARQPTDHSRHLSTT